MARTIVITIPEDGDLMEHGDYVQTVGGQMAEGYLSGHVDPEHHWTTETT